MDYYHKSVYVSSFLQVSLSLDTFGYNAVEYHYNTLELKSLFNRVTILQSSYNTSMPLNYGVSFVKSDTHSSFFPFFAFCSIMLY